MLAFLLLSSLPTDVRAQGSLRVVVGPVRLVFDKGTVEQKVFTTFLAGEARGRVKIELFDAVIDPNGGWSQVTLGSTDASLEDYVELDGVSFDYEPDGREQQFNTVVTVRDVPDGRAAYGIIVATLSGLDEPEADEAGIAAAAAIQVIVAPPGTTVEPTTVKLSIDRFDILQLEPWTPIDTALPDIPGVIGRGPALFFVEGENIGEGAVEQTTTFEVRRISPFAALGSDSASDLPPALVRVTLAPKLLLPGQRYFSKGDSLIPLDGQPSIDSLPFIGFVTVTVRVVGRVGSVETEVVRTRTLLLVPWSELLFSLGAWVLISGRRRRRHSTPQPPARILQRVGDVPRGRRLTQRLRRRLRRGSGSDPDQPTLF